MIPNEFDYVAPASVEEAIALLRQHGDRGKILAGGHSLIPLMKLRLAAPEVLIDIGRLPGLREIRRDGNGVRIGALCTHGQIATSAEVQAAAPVLASAAAQVGDPQVRNRGTIGGNLAHADPASDLPAVVLALDAEIEMQGPNGKRSVKAADFFTGMFTTALGADEILTAVRVPAVGSGAGSAYAKLENRASGYALVGVAAVVSASGGTCRSARIGVTGATAVAARATAAEASLVGKELNDWSIAEAAGLVPDGLDVIGDLHGSIEYRTAMLKAFAAKAIRRAIAAAG